jgi:hypothetical protein
MTTIGRWSPNKVRNKIIDTQWVSETRYAFELVKPSSIAKTGGSSTATVSALGSVEFALCETLSLDGVFSSEYDNYMIVMRGSASAALNAFTRLRASGSDATGANYTAQFLDANNTSITGVRDVTQTSAATTDISDAANNGFQLYLYGPALAQPTAARSVTANGRDSARISDRAWTHSLSTAYDGFTFFRSGAATMSGRIAVYGMRG